MPVAVPVACCVMPAAPGGLPGGAEGCGLRRPVRPRGELRASPQLAATASRCRHGPRCAYRAICAQRVQPDVTSAPSHRASRPPAAPTRIPPHPSPDTSATSAHRLRQRRTAAPGSSLLSCHGRARARWRPEHAPAQSLLVRLARSSAAAVPLPCTLCRCWVPPGRVARRGHFL